MAPTQLRGYLDAVGELPADCLLGHFVFFTICEAFYERTKIEQWFTELDLNDGFVPVPDNPANAFKKAVTDTREAERRVVYPHTTAAGARWDACLLLRDLPALNKQLQIGIVRELKTSPLTHKQVGVVKFQPATVRDGRTVPGTAQVTATIDPTWSLAEDYPEIRRVADAVTFRYDRYLNFTDDMKVRAMVRDYLGYLNGCKLRPAVYFVHASRADELARLVELVARLGQGCSMTRLAIPDLQEAREAIMTAWQDEAVAALNGLIKDIATLRSARKRITGAAWAKVKRSYDEIVAKSKEYSASLGLAQDRTDGAQEMAMEALVSLQHQMINGVAQEHQHHPLSPVRRP